MQQHCGQDAAVRVQVNPGHDQRQGDVEDDEGPEAGQLEAHLRMPAIRHEIERQVPDSPGKAQQERAGEHPKAPDQRLEGITAPAELLGERTGHEADQGCQRDRERAGQQAFELGHAGQEVGSLADVRAGYPYLTDKY